MEKGTLLRTKTRTRNDVFGEVLWEVEAVGLPAPERERRENGAKDGVRCVMLGGSGPAARKGYVVVDSEERIARDVKAKVTEVLPAGRKAELAAKYERKATGRGSGVVEM